MSAAGAAVWLAACGGGGGGMSMPAGTAMGCMPDASGMNMGCMAPAITLHSPGAHVHLTVTLSATATAMMSGDEMLQVDFMVDGTRVGTAGMAPYSVKWDSTTVGDGAHTLTATVMDNMGQTTSSAPVSVSVDNHPTFTLALGATQLVPAPASAATGTATLAVRLASGTLSGKVMLGGVTATGVTVNEGFAGDSGAALVTLSANGAAGEWDVPAGALLSAAQVTALLAGKLYLVATSAAHPHGEIRGQVTPANVTVRFAAMDGAQEVPPVSIAAAGTAAVTVDTDARTLSVHVHASGVDDAMAAEVASGPAGATGAKLVTLAQDAVDPGHWAMELAPVTAADLANFDASAWYVNVATPAEPAGAIRGQLDAPAH